MDKLEKLVKYMEEYLVGLDSQLEELEIEMEKLDMNSKDYLELDFEYNHTSGQRMAVNYILSVYKNMEG